MNQLTLRKTDNTTKRALRETVAHVLFALAASVSIVAVCLICFFLLLNGLPAIAQIGLFNFVGTTTWRPSADEYGILAMIVGSLYVTAGAIIIGVPLGLLCAIFLSRFASRRLKKIILPGIELLSGIPSVVFGFFGLVALVPLIRQFFDVQGMGILTASIILGMMILPTIITVSKSALDAVPNNYYEGALALGANHERCVFRIVFPAALSGVMAAIILGVGRAIGETMAVVMIVGNQVRIPNAITDGVRTLTGNIVLEMGYAADLHREALIGTAVVLFVFILIINLLFSLLKRRSKL
ncbi:MAG: phosphate ABC transporter permease subunit PstC [Coriobacteriales bacterium]|jgi:phosphate transport system permease protein|nr:phosphate ABC transporter permease subunit PstC [Coriobacteriales bacterium]